MESHSYRKLIVACAALILILIVLGFIAGPLRAPSAPSDTVPELQVPQFTEETRAKLESRTVFNALVSYTDSGFEPHDVVLANGETIRVSNNADTDLTITDATIGTSYGAGACDIESLITCTPIAPMDFWEFTFEKTGDWTLRSRTGKEVVVHVR